MKKLNYILDLFKLIIAKLVSPILKINKSNRDIWIVGERKSEAKDNGYLVSAAGYTYKSKKKKGEVVAEAWAVKCVASYDEIWDEGEGA